MKFEIVTIFPDSFRGPLDYGIVRRAREASFIEIKIHDLRAFTTDRHKTVDDRPFGGGEGMVLKPEPLFECVESLKLAPREQRLAGKAKETVVLLSPQGRMFTQAVAEEMAALEVLIGGNDEQRRKWRKGRALEKTLRNRPDLLERQPLSEEDKKFLAEVGKKKVGCE